MKSAVMQRETSYGQNKKILNSRGSDATREGGSECILFCKRVAKHVFDVQDGFVVIPDGQDCFDDGVCLTTNFTKVVLVFDRDAYRAVEPGPSFEF